MVRSRGGEVQKHASRGRDTAAESNLTGFRHTIFDSFPRPWEEFAVPNFEAPEWQTCQKCLHAHPRRRVGPAG